MKLFIRLCFVMAMVGEFAGAGTARAEEQHEIQEGPYLVVDGYVKQISARILTVNDQQYPLSKFARVFDNNGNELSVQKAAIIGKIDRAKVYILGGRVEKIIVIKNI